MHPALLSKAHIGTGGRAEMGAIVSSVGETVAWVAKSSQSTPTQLPTASLPHPTPRQLLSASTEVLLVILYQFHHERKQRKSMEICDCVFMC